MIGIYRVENLDKECGYITLDPMPDSRIFADKLARYIASREIAFFESTTCNVYLVDIKEK